MGEFGCDRDKKLTIDKNAEQAINRLSLFSKSLIDKGNLADAEQILRIANNIKIYAVKNAEG